MTWIIQEFVKCLDYPEVFKKLSFLRVEEDHGYTNQVKLKPNNKDENRENFLLGFPIEYTSMTPHKAEWITLTDFSEWIKHIGTMRTEGSYVIMEFIPEIYMTSDDVFAMLGETGFEVLEQEMNGEVRIIRKLRIHEISLGPFYREVIEGFKKKQENR